MGSTVSCYDDCIVYDQLLSKYQWLFGISCMCCTINIPYCPLMNTILLCQKDESKDCHAAAPRVKLW